MSHRYNKTQIERLEQYKTTFENALNHPVITPTLAEFGYDEEKLSEGKQLYIVAKNAYDFKITEDDETKKARYELDTKLEELYSIYYPHRRKAKAIFKRDPVTLHLLGINGSIPTDYLSRMEIIQKFYIEILNDETLQHRLSAIKINLEDLTKANNIIAEVVSNRFEYVREKGESQDATEQKTIALKVIDDWMDDFYDIAEIAFEDNPQLLEVLGVFVRS